MLEGCHAYIIAHTEAQNRSLVNLAHRAGFSTVGTVFGEGAAPLDHQGTHLTFFLLHHQLSEVAMRSIIRAIRSSANDNVRFAPIIMIINDCPFETILRFIRLGYDDVITLPEKREVLVSRLSTQLNAEQVYFQTDTYLGPDRQRMELSAEDRTTAQQAHTRYNISRHPQKGIQILVRTEFMVQAAETPGTRQFGSVRLAG